ncbi:MAG: phosphotransferase [Anaerolineales bacterium]
MNTPVNLEAVTLSWLRAALAGAGEFVPGDLIGFEMIRIGGEVAYSGQLARCRLHFRRSAANAPRSIVVKITPLRAAVHPFFSTENRHEVLFYQQFASATIAPIPKCYFGKIDEQAGVCVLLLQDLSDMRSVDAAIGCSPEQADLVIRHMAEFHAGWWNNAALGASAWLPDCTDFADTPYMDWWRRYPRAIAQTVAGRSISRAYFETGRRLFERLPVILAELAQPPVTCIHRDFYADNILFGSSPDEPPLMVVDWSLVGRGRGVADVTYFMVGSMSPEQRRATEHGLVRTYHAQLLARGIREYSFAECWRDYRLAVVGKLFVSVLATVLFDNSSPRRRAWRLADLQRLHAFLEDHQLAALV